MSSLIIGGASKEHEREGSDFYPTPWECTVALLDFLNLPTNIIISEPACGDGAISKVLGARGYRVISSDIRDTGFGFDHVDFLASPPNDVDVIITNPPFNLAERFIKKATSECGIVAMFLKSQYWHAAGRYNTFTKNKPAYVLPLTWRPNFLPGRGKAPLMDMLWTVWIEGDNSCIYQPLLKPSKQPKLF